MRSRVLLVLAVFVVVDAAGIGLLLTRQEPAGGADAIEQCRSEVRSQAPQDQGACIRKEIYPRETGTSRLVVAVPLVLGLTAIVSIGYALGRGPRPNACPVCRGDAGPTDVDCPHCGYPLAS